MNRRKMMKRSLPGILLLVGAPLLVGALLLACSRLSVPAPPPSLVFIKGLKVGGTTLAIALDKVARRYNLTSNTKISERINTQAMVGQVLCNDSIKIWYHHGYKHEWMERCLVNPKYVALLRDPIAQALSWEQFDINRRYHLYYPITKCENVSSSSWDFAKLRPESELLLGLKSVQHCEHTELRRNLTMQLVAHRVIRALNAPANHWLAPGKSLDWMLGSRNANLVSTALDSNKAIATLQAQYLFLGVTDKLNELLVLLAWYMKWDMEAMYYTPCKQHTDLAFSPAEFKLAFPRLYKQLSLWLAPHVRVYDAVAKAFNSEFASHPELASKLERFTHGLNEYQRHHHHQSKQWQRYEYVDGMQEYC
ncbi:hypothetical protein BASA81_003665 [Batrachochytrium salamandrivorans]|nr:hypothetical protein BASA81_003665 [Batrachochytrium salamandrivorans]